LKFKESGDPLTSEEYAAMKARHGDDFDPADNFVPYTERTPELRLYRKFVREFLKSEKIERAQRTGGAWNVDKKLKHVWQRYCNDDAYAGISVPMKRQIMGKALFDATGEDRNLEDVHVEEDYATRESAALSERFNPTIAEQVAAGLKVALADKATFGVYKLVKIASALRDGTRRLEVAQRYAARFGKTGAGSDAIDIKSLNGLDDEGTLGVAAAFLALKLERFNRREATLLAAQTLTVTGNALSAVPIAGQVFSVAGTVTSGVVTVEQAFRNVCKRLDGNLGTARETIAVALWGLGNRSHPATLEFLTELAILDEDGYLRSAGLFHRRNMRLASNFIATELKSVGR
jgi:hypothetical protein